MQFWIRREKPSLGSFWCLHFWCHDLSVFQCKNLMGRGEISDKCDNTCCMIIAGSGIAQKRTDPLLLPMLLLHIGVCVWTPELLRKTKILHITRETSHILWNILCSSHHLNWGEGAVTPAETQTAVVRLWQKNYKSCIECKFGWNAWFDWFSLWAFEKDCSNLTSNMRLLKAFRKSSRMCSWMSGPELCLQVEPSVVRLIHFPQSRAAFKPWLMPFFVRGDRILFLPRENFTWQSAPPSEMQAGRTHAGHTSTGNEPNTYRRLAWTPG